MSKDKTLKLVHTEKIAKNLADGWEISKINKTIKK